MIIESIDEAVDSGARLRRACQEVGVDSRTIQRWKKRADGGEDQRRGPKSKPTNSLSVEEQKTVLSIANSPTFRDLCPHQIVPTLADQGVYVASESSFFRILNEEQLNTHRSASKPSTHKKPNEHKATAPKVVWSWDITYLKAPVLGTFFYLYMIVDVFSRKIVGYSVCDVELSDYAARLVDLACQKEGIRKGTLVLHQDNGSPMKGAMLQATLEKLKVAASFSRPHVSDDNPFSESLFRTLKYRPEYPTKPFTSIEAAREWVECFVHWYNNEHLHSAIRYVTPNQRHAGEDEAILSQRQNVYERARQKHPQRWSGKTRNWDSIEEVYLNPEEPCNHVNPRRYVPRTEAS